MLNHIGNWIRGERRAIAVVVGCGCLGAAFGFFIDDVFRHAAICMVCSLIGICLRRQTLI